MTTDAHLSSLEPLTIKLQRHLRSDLERLAEKNERSLAAEIRLALKKHVTAEARQAA